MNYIEINIFTNSEAVNFLVMELSQLGITGFVIHDSADFKEFVENKEANWDYIDDELMNLKNSPTYITAYLQDNAQGAEMLSAVRGALDELKKKDQNNFYGKLKLELSSVCEEDWANNWKQYYKPFNVGEKLVIKPSWEEIDNTENRLVLEIDPASAFGTGQHHTTRLCLELLEQNIKPGGKVLDLGCGSGILAIGALLLGARKVTCVDIFENAVSTASENIEKNRFSERRYKAYCGNIIEDIALREKIGSGYSIITANIVADVIISMAKLFEEFAFEETKIIISGIITERLDEVKEALQKQEIIIEKINECEGWNALLCHF